MNNPKFTPKPPRLQAREACADCMAMRCCGRCWCCLPWPVYFEPGRVIPLVAWKRAKAN